MKRDRLEAKSLLPKVGMTREWEMVEGEKKGRSSREAKRLVHHMFISSYVHMLNEHCSYYMLMLKYADMIICYYA